MSGGLVRPALEHAGGEPATMVGIGVGRRPRCCGGRLDRCVEYLGSPAPERSLETESERRIESPRRGRGLADLA